MTTDPQTELSEPDNPAAWALARHIADHPVSTIQAAFRYLNAPLAIDLHEAVSSAVAQSAPAKAALRDRILQALADALKPRYGGPQHNTPGGLPLTATAEEARLHRARPLADAVLAVLPAAAPTVSSVGQAAHTTRSADEHLARIHEWVTSDVVTARNEFGNGYREAQRDIRDLIKGRFDNHAAAELRRMADETQPAEAEGPSCGCPSEDAIEHGFGTEDCTCIPFTRQETPPRYLNRPTDTVEMISGWERGRDCPHHKPAVGAQQPKEADRG